MMRRSGVFLIGLAVVFASPAFADVGVPTLTITPSTTPAREILLDFDVTTTGATAPTTTDSMYMFASVYYPFPYTIATTTLTDTTYAPRTGTSALFEHTFSFTVASAGLWGVYGFAASTPYASPSTSQYETVFMAEGFPVPTISFPGIALLGALLAGIGIFILRRT